MKTPDQVVDDIRKRLERTWAADLTTGPDQAWPHAFPLGQLRGSDLTEAFTKVLTASEDWKDWAEDKVGVRLRFAHRRVHGTEQRLPTHLEIDTIDTAAALAPADWVPRINRGRDRAKTLRAAYPHLQRPDRVLAACDTLTDLDFDLLQRAAAWFATNHASGLTPRQVPIEGLHAKWLNTRHELVRTLANVDDLGLLPAHPQRIHFTYLDPAHLATGGRRHDSYSVGDTTALPYKPRTLLICENKDTAIGFGPVHQGIAIEGAGNAAVLLARIDWIHEAPHVIYWGDLDIDGFTILDAVRAAGLNVTSMLMDQDTWDTWSKYGTTTDRRGRDLAGVTRDLTHLTPPEQQVYQHLLTAPAGSVRRLEQERIPLHVAAAALTTLTTVT